MTPSEDDALWKRRFEAFALVRLSGLVFLFGGLMVALKNPFGEEFPVIGTLLAISGAADLLFGPRLLKKIWAEEDR
ncbi:hypothetical protein [Sphingomicrobium astaxanthinifaciens]|uniref:hypothetical protein n=1 Tax=Sphingomicrobium astaxanthinifaciens TaxID=1227949 RepID=UPI001FCBCD9A|nr:hypothetical protein [Sphingomicrobium astaxanthinifaciens]MCJ7420847.1 hypothetical protein [Sphingomicrobium astaxanthinifaciens]